MDNESTFKEGALKVWWIPQVPMKPYQVIVNSLQEAKKILTVLGEYDQFQYKNHIKSDYSNAGGLMIFKNEEWSDWENEKGESIDDISFP